jgi:hypothetical protein
LGFGRGISKNTNKSLRLSIVQKRISFGLLVRVDDGGCANMSGIGEKKPGDFHRPRGRIKSDINNIIIFLKRNDVSRIR